MINLLTSSVNDEANEAYHYFYDELYRWTHNWHECTLVCRAYGFVMFLNIALHLALNVFELRGWGGGSFWLKLNTKYTLLMNWWGWLLMVGAPAFMMASYEFRRLVFIMSMWSVVNFMGTMFSFSFRYFAGATPMDDLYETFQLYWILLQLGALVPSVYIAMYEGFAHSPFAIFNEDYGNWDKHKIPGQRDHNP